MVANSFTKADPWLSGLSSKVFSRTAIPAPVAPQFVRVGSVPPANKFPVPLKNLDALDPKEGAASKAFNPIARDGIKLERALALSEPIRSVKFLGFVYPPVRLSIPRSKFSETGVK